MEHAGSELPELVQSGRGVREQVQAGDRVAGDHDGAIVDAIVDPVLGDGQALSKLGTVR